MPALYISIGPWTLQTFTLAVALTIALSAGVGLRRARRDPAFRYAPVIDAYLTAFVGGVIGARLFHVLLNLDYFSDNLNEAFNLSAGGLDWHGAVMGGVMGLWIISWWHVRRGEPPVRLYKNGSFHDLLDTLTPALPLIGLGAWYGCLAAGCGYGKEVDTLANYSSLAASELVDVFGIVAPRYNTPFFGLTLSALVLLIVIVMWWRGWLGGRRFWFSLALLSAGMFVIGFFRGDHRPDLAGLRPDQWLDVGFLVVSCWLFVKNTGHAARKAES